MKADHYKQIKSHHCLKANKELATLIKIQRQQPMKEISILYLISGPVKLIVHMFNLKR